MTVVYLGLGSNLGQRKKNIILAIRKLTKVRGIKLEKVSSLYQSAPWGYKKQPDFLNAVVKISTVHSPPDLLKIIKKLEGEIGRRKSFRWGPRKIDIDILLYGQKVIRQKLLTVPHKHLLVRRFVLEPLLEISPNLRYPLTGRLLKGYYQKILGANSQKVVFQEKLLWKELQ